MSSRALVLGLCVSNAALLVAVLVLSTERGRKRLAALIPKTRRDSEDAALGTLLGKDYKPPLPHPIPEVLDRACLAYLATSSEASPHTKSAGWASSKCSHVRSTAICGGLTTRWRSGEIWQYVAS